MIGLKVIYEKKPYIIYVSKGVKVLVTDEQDDNKFGDVLFVNIKDILNLDFDKDNLDLKKAKNFFDFYVDIIVKNILINF